MLINLKLLIFTFNQWTFAPPYSVMFFSSENTMMRFLKSILLLMVLAAVAKCSTNGQEKGVINITCS